MCVAVVYVGHVGMCVSQRVVAVPMAVRPCGHGGVAVGVVPVVVAVGMFVLQGLVCVLVTMGFGQV